MALLGFWGFDDAAPEPGLTAPGGLFSGLVNAAAAVRTGGTYGYRAYGGTSVASSTVGYLGVAPTNTLIFGGAYTTPALGNWLLALTDGTSNQLALTCTAAGLLQLRLGGITGTILATSTVPLVVNTWTYVEIKAVISATAGSVEVRLGGATVLTATGNTQGAAGVSTISQVWLGGTAASASTNYWDDAYLLDTTGPAPWNTFLGDIAVATLLPTGNGASAGWLGSDGNSTDNYLLVDEVPASATDYVGSATSGATDLYQMGDVPTTYDVLAVQNLPYLGASDTGTPPVVIPVIKTPTGTTQADAPVTPLSTSYGLRGGTLRTVDPDGNPWSVTTLNGIQVGVKIQ